MLTIKGDINHVTRDGQFIGSARLANADLAVGDDLIVADLFSTEEFVGRVVSVEGERVLVDVMWDPSPLLLPTDSSGVSFIDCVCA
jgi:hypothetical protein